MSRYPGPAKPRQKRGQRDEVERRKICRRALVDRLLPIAELTNSNVAGCRCAWRAVYLRRRVHMRKMRQMQVPVQTSGEKRQQAEREIPPRNK